MKKNKILAITVSLILATALTIVLMLTGSLFASDKDDASRFTSAFCTEACYICDSDKMQGLKEWAVRDGIVIDPHHWHYVTENTVTISMEDLKEQYPLFYASIIESALEAGLDPSNFSSVTTAFPGAYDFPADGVFLNNGDNELNNWQCSLFGHSYGEFVPAPGLSSIIHQTSGVCNHTHAGCQKKLVSMASCTRCGHSKTVTTYECAHPCGGCTGCHFQHVWSNTQTKLLIEHSGRPHPTTCVMVAENTQSCLRDGCYTINTTTTRTPFMCHDPNLQPESEDDAVD